MELKLSPHVRTYPVLGPALLEDLRQRKFRKIALQVPAGLVTMATNYEDEIARETGAQVVHVARACFGACDPPSVGELQGAEALVSLGHAPIPNMAVALPTYLVEMRVGRADVGGVADLIERNNLPRRLGVVASVQHLDDLPALGEALRQRGRELVVGQGAARLAYPGQALGCNYASATSVQDRVEAFLFLGTGLFHPLGLAYSVSKPVWMLDPLQLRIEGPLDREKMIARRLLQIERAMDARRWGVLVSTFPGQNRSTLAHRLVAKARGRGREAFLLTFDRLSPPDLLGRGADAYVNTACPRIATDDGDSYDRPVLTPPEFLSAIGERPLTPYLFDLFP